MTSRQLYKSLSEEVDEDMYQEARDEAFNDEFKLEFMKIIEGNEIVTEDDIQGFLDSFTFPDYEDWATDWVESKIDDYFDSKYQLEKDERMGL